jgi:hypothetical protein
MEERRKLKEAAQWIALMFCEVQEVLKTEYSFPEDKALEWASILLTLMTCTPPNGSENAAVSKFCPQSETDRSNADGQKSTETPHKVLSQKPAEGVPGEKRTEVEQEKPFSSKWFRGKS